MAGCTSNEAPVTDEGLWKDARPTGASLPYPRDTPTIIARHRTACTSHKTILERPRLRTVLAQFGAHYNGRRPHRALRLRPPHPDHPYPDLDRQRIRRRPVLGGLINEYERVAQNDRSAGTA
jgi:hypothetical protein